MIISRTPLRISFAGGGTDLRPYYEVSPGAVIGTTINKYVYVAVNRLIDKTIKLSYWKTEIVNSIDQLEHDIVRKSLEMLEMKNGIDIVSMSDIPAGTGLGSSGSFTIGLLNALHAYKGQFVSKEQLAQEACQVEINLLGAPIGKQDQYFASYGGLNYIEFSPDESVFVKPAVCSLARRRELENNLLLFYTGQARQAGIILEQQHRQTKQENQFTLLTKMKEIASELSRVLLEGKDMREFGNLLQQEWLYKRQVVDGITNNSIDAYYEDACRAGALGGKLTGAGSGGFLLFYCEKDKQNHVREALKDLTEVDVAFDTQGSSIIAVS
ncbi:GHMP kinase [Chloroflexota bacterium]